LPPELKNEISPMSVPEEAHLPVEKSNRITAPVGSVICPFAVDPEVIEIVKELAVVANCRTFKLTVNP